MGDVKARTFTVGCTEMTEDGWTLNKLHVLATLRDVYEELLPPRQKQVLKLKLDEDLSLGEMAEELGTTRQACEDALKRGIRALEAFERKLGLMELRDRRSRERRCLLGLLASMDQENWQKVRDKMLEVLLPEEGRALNGV